MTPPLFVSSQPFESERVHAVAIYCSDGRFGDQIDDFLHHHLGLPNYDRLALAGGPAWLSYRSSASLIQYGMVRDQLDFLVEAHRLRRVVLLAHHGCAYYLRRLGTDADSALATQIQDLRDAEATVRDWYRGLQIECYVARAVGERVQFEAIPRR